MTKSPKNPALLPSGFTDLLPPDAEREAQAIGKLMNVFRSFGYNRVKPPLLEFEDSLFSGAGASMIQETFRVMDPVSHRMMGVRSDITPQIARIASSRLGGEKRPLRVCYANDVLRTRAGQQRTERQFTQVGCEIIGEKNIEADIESCVVALIALNDIGVKNITIDLAYPAIVNAALETLSDEAREKVIRALERRSIDGVKALAKSSAKFLVGLMVAAGPAKATLKKLDALKMPASAKARVKELKRIALGIEKAAAELGLKNVSVTIDPVETRGFKYYSGTGFTVFSKGVAGALGRGGRYDITFGGRKAESASGFTLYMDTVRKALPQDQKARVAKVDYTQSWKKIRDAQKKGAVVVRGKK